MNPPWRSGSSFSRTCRPSRLPAMSSRACWVIRTAGYGVFGDTTTGPVGIGSEVAMTPRP